MKLSGLVLAGGRSPLTGKPRALLPFRGRPVVAWTAAALSRFCREVLVVSSVDGAEELRKALRFRFRLVEDQFVGLGAVGGLHAGCLSAAHPHVAVTTCDAPFPGPRLYEFLLRKAVGHDGALPLVSNRREPLHAVYRRDRLLRALEAGISRGRPELGAVLSKLDLQKVGPGHVRSLDPGRRTLLRFKTPEAASAAEGL